MKILHLPAAAAILFAGFFTFSNLGAAENKSAGNMKFKRLFCWGYPGNEMQAKKYADAGVTDIITATPKQYALARKYGMTPYWKVFLPKGPYTQVMTPEEQKYSDYINGADLDKKISSADRMKILHRRRVEKQYRYGGDSITEISAITTEIPCFSSDKDLTLSKKALDEQLQSAPEGVAGIFMDYFGYINNKGCYCQNCLRKYRKFLKKNKLADTPQNKAVFYRNEIVDYYNKVIDHVKSKRPAYKIVIHVYPLFKPDPLYGNRIRADYCGQTVAWYFKWDEKKIRAYTDFVLRHAKDYYKTAEGIPFLGINHDKKSSLKYKTPEELESELQTILRAGGRTLMVCTGSVIIKDGYCEVFRKYCSKEPSK